MFLYMSVAMCIQVYVDYLKEIASKMVNKTTRNERADARSQPKTSAIALHHRCCLAY